jgi:hypothetical protein
MLVGENNNDIYHSAGEDHRRPDEQAAAPRFILREFIDGKSIDRRHLRGA